MMIDFESIFTSRSSKNKINEMKRVDFVGRIPAYKKNIWRAYESHDSIDEMRSVNCKKIPPFLSYFSNNRISIPLKTAHCHHCQSTLSFKQVSILPLKDFQNYNSPTANNHARSGISADNPVLLGQNIELQLQLQLIGYNSTTSNLDLSKVENFIYKFVKILIFLNGNDDYLLKTLDIYPGTFLEKLTSVQIQIPFDYKYCGLQEIKLYLFAYESFTFVDGDGDDIRTDKPEIELLILENYQPEITESYSVSVENLDVIYGKDEISDKLSALNTRKITGKRSTRQKSLKKISKNFVKRYLNIECPRILDRYSMKLLNHADDEANFIKETLILNRFGPENILFVDLMVGSSRLGDLVADADEVSTLKVAYTQSNDLNNANSWTYLVTSIADMSEASHNSLQIIEYPNKPIYFHFIPNNKDIAFGFPACGQEHLFMIEITGQGDQNYQNNRIYFRGRHEYDFVNQRPCQSEDRQIFSEPTPKEGLPRLFQTNSENVIIEPLIFTNIENIDLNEQSLKPNKLFLNQPFEIMISWLIKIPRHFVQLNINPSSDVDPNKKATVTVNQAFKDYNSNNSLIQPLDPKKLHVSLYPNDKRFLDLVFRSFPEDQRNFMENLQVIIDENSRERFTFENNCDPSHNLIPNKLNKNTYTIFDPDQVGNRQTYDIDWYLACSQVFNISMPRFSYCMHDEFDCRLNVTYDQDYDVNIAKLKEKVSVKPVFSESTLPILTLKRLEPSIEDKYSDKSLTWTVYNDPERLSGGKGELAIRFMMDAFYFDSRFVDANQDNNLKNTLKFSVDILTYPGQNDFGTKRSLSSAEIQPLEFTDQDFYNPEDFYIFKKIVTIKVPEINSNQITKWCFKTWNSKENIEGRNETLSIRVNIEAFDAENGVVSETLDFSDQILYCYNSLHTVLIDECRLKFCGNGNSQTDCVDTLYSYQCLAPNERRRREAEIPTRKRRETELSTSSNHLTKDQIIQNYLLSDQNIFKSQLSDPLQDDDDNHCQTDSDCYLDDNSRTGRCENSFCICHPYYRLKMDQNGSNKLTCSHLYSSAWTEWSETCSASCGIGYRKRSRRQFDEMITETKPCHDKPCLSIVPDPCTTELDLCDQKSGKGYCFRDDKNGQEVSYHCECRDSSFYYDQNRMACLRNETIFENFESEKVINNNNNIHQNLVQNQTDSTTQEKSCKKGSKCFQTQNLDFSNMKCYDSTTHFSSLENGYVQHKLPITFLDYYNFINIFENGMATFDHLLNNNSTFLTEQLASLRFVQYKNEEISTTNPEDGTITKTPLEDSDARFDDLEFVILSNWMNTVAVANKSKFCVDESKIFDVKQQIDIYWLDMAAAWISESVISYKTSLAIEDDKLQITNTLLDFSCVYMYYQLEREYAVGNPVYTGAIITTPLGRYQKEKLEIELKTIEDQENALIRSMFPQEFQSESKNLGKCYKSSLVDKRNYERFYNVKRLVKMDSEICKEQKIVISLKNSLEKPFYSLQQTCRNWLQQESLAEENWKKYLLTQNSASDASVEENSEKMYQVQDIIDQCPLTISVLGNSDSKGKSLNLENLLWQSEETFYERFCGSSDQSDNSMLSTELLSKIQSFCASISTGKYQLYHSTENQNTNCWRRNPLPDRFTIKCCYSNVTHGLISSLDTPIMTSSSMVMKNENTDLLRGFDTTELATISSVNEELVRLSCCLESDLLCQKYQKFRPLPSNTGSGKTSEANYILSNKEIDWNKFVTFDNLAFSSIFTGAYTMLRLPFENQQTTNSEQQISAQNQQKSEVFDYFEVSGFWGCDNQNIEGISKTRLESIVIHDSKNMIRADLDLEEINRTDKPSRLINFTYSNMTHSCELDVFGEKSVLEDKNRNFCASSDQEDGSSNNNNSEENPDKSQTSTILNFLSSDIENLQIDPKTQTSCLNCTVFILKEFSIIFMIDYRMQEILDEKTNEIRNFYSLILKTQAPIVEGKKLQGLMGRINKDWSDDVSLRHNYTKFRLGNEYDDEHFSDQRLEDFWSSWSYHRSFQALSNYDPFQIFNGQISKLNQFRCFDNISKSNSSIEFPKSKKSTIIGHHSNGNSLFSNPQLADDIASIKVTCSPYIYIKNQFIDLIDSEINFRDIVLPEILNELVCNVTILDFTKIENSTKIEVSIIDPENYENIRIDFSNYSFDYDDVQLLKATNTTEVQYKINYGDLKEKDIQNLLNLFDKRIGYFTLSDIYQPIIEVKLQKKNIADKILIQTIFVKFIECSADCENNDCHQENFENLIKDNSYYLDKRDSDQQFLQNNLPFWYQKVSCKQTIFREMSGPNQLKKCFPSTIDKSKRVWKLDPCDPTQNKTVALAKCSSDCNQSLRSAGVISDDSDISYSYLNKFAQRVNNNTNSTSAATILSFFPKKSITRYCVPETCHAALDRQNMVNKQCFSETGGADLCKYGFKTCSGWGAICNVDKCLCTIPGTKLVYEDPESQTRGVCVDVDECAEDPRIMTEFDLNIDQDQVNSQVEEISYDIQKWWNKPEFTSSNGPWTSKIYRLKNMDPKKNRLRCHMRCENLSSKEERLVNTNGTDVLRLGYQCTCPEGFTYNIKDNKCYDKFNINSPVFDKLSSTNNTNSYSQQDYNNNLCKNQCQSSDPDFCEIKKGHYSCKCNRPGMVLHDNLRDCICTGYNLCLAVNSATEEIRCVDQKFVKRKVNADWEVQELGCTF